MHCGQLCQVIECARSLTQPFISPCLCRHDAELLATGPGLSDGRFLVRTRGSDYVISVVYKGEHPLICSPSDMINRSIVLACIHAMHSHLITLTNHEQILSTSHVLVSLCLAENSLHSCCSSHRQRNPSSCEQSRRRADCEQETVRWPCND